jgi:tetratricopeptide (TPR) repeat protein
MTQHILFNPAFQTTQQSIDGFAARADILDDLLGLLRAPLREANNHALILGPRGFGKSTLVRRIIAEIETDAALGARWEPVALPEEPYEVSKLSELWLEALRRLADTRHDPALSRLHAELKRDRDDDRVGRVALDALRDWATRHQRRILLVVENLDMLFDNALDVHTEWALRKVLQSEPSLMLLATAVRRFEGLEAHDRAFYEALQRFELPPLTPAEIADLWHGATGHRPPIPRCQAVRVLTGGNPRMVRLLASLSTGSSLRAILDELTTLVDRHTDYFKGNIEALSGHKRRVFLALATLWRPATAHQVAVEARLDTNLVSSELNRLAIDGRVEVVPRSGRAKVYQVSERLYNIYYLMRRAGGDDARVRALVDFVAVFYEPDELGAFVSRLRDEHGADAHAACVHLVEELYRRRRDPRARTAIAAAVDGTMLEKAPSVRRGIRRDPAEVLAALRGAMGDAAVPDAIACLEQNIEAPDATLLDLAEEVLRRPPVDDVAAATVLVGGDGARARATFREATDPQRRATLLFAGAWFAVHRRSPPEARAWLAARTALHPSEQEPDRALTALTLVVEPEHPTAFVACLRELPGLADAAFSYVVKHEGLLDHAIASLIAASSPTPVHRAALALALSLAGRLDEAAEVADALATELPNATTSLAAAAYAWHAGRPERASHHAEASLAAKDTPLALVLTAKLTSDPAALAALRQRAGDALVRTTGDPKAWALAAVAPARAVTRAWERLSKRDRTTLQGAMLRGSLASELPEVWRWALDHYRPSSDPNDLIAAARLWGRCGRPDEAARQFTMLLARDDVSTRGLSATVDLCISLAAAGHGTEALRALTSSGHADALRPLLIALGDHERTANASPEELQVAADIVQRLEERRAMPEIWAIPGHHVLDPPRLAAFA